MSSNDHVSENDNVTEQQPKKEYTQEEILQIVASTMDEHTKTIKELSNKIRHFDQFKEDIMAQVDTILLKLSDDTRPSGTTSEQPQQPKAAITPEGVQGIMDTGMKIAQTISDIITKFKTPALADQNSTDPLAQMKYEIGNRVVEKQLNPRVTKQSINFEDLLTDH